MVRLKPSGVYKTNLRVKSQFHYGSIKTFYCLNLFFLIEHLNSTMVRLKRNSKDSSRNTKLYLNSTMVRLKPVIGNTAYYVSEEKSQFHYGSIKTKK